MKSQQALTAFVVGLAAWAAPPVLAATAPNQVVITSQRLASDGSRAVDATWNAPADGGSPITGYTATVHDARYGTQVGQLNVSSTTLSARIPSSQPCGVDMYVRVKAANAIGLSPASVPLGALQFPCPATPTPTPAPTGLLAPVLTSSNVAWNSATLSWTAVSGATRYTLQQSTLGTFPDTQTITVYSGTSLSRTLSLTYTGSTAFFRVRAENTTSFGPWSAFAGVTQPAPPITLATPALAGTKSATGWSASLSWTAINGAATYELQYSQSGSFNPFSSSSPTTNSASVSLPGPGTWYFRVRAKSATGWSNFSNSLPLSYQ